MAERVYECTECGEQVSLDERQPVPECCGKPMKQVPLEACRKAGDFEQARNADRDEACDDFVR